MIEAEEREYMNYLIVVAHPDDEVLGAGATIHKLTEEGHYVDICIMCGEVRARNFRPNDNDLNRDIEESNRLLRIRNRYIGMFPNIEMNTVAHIELVRFIEKSIVEAQADIVITHHPADVNNDHLQTSLACQAAVRLFQRRIEVKPLKELWFMEVLSATEWSVNSAWNRFVPNLYVEIGKEGVKVKKAALAAYRGVIRQYPHPRSEEAIEGLAVFRGAQSGCNYAEAFECVFRRLCDAEEEL